ncbi:hypothetical protein OAJ65_01995 [Flavobacteriales bacterium]|nr:hypothetical protein [Flavobacteriales bacterium]
MKKQLILGNLLPLLLGSLIYISFRSDTLLIFKFFSALSIDTPIEYLRENTMGLKQYLPDWFLFSLPDGLWVFSYVSLMLLIWNNTISKYNIFWIILIPIIAVLSEFGQSIKITPGTFDPLDLIFYILGTFFSLLIFTNTNQLNIKKI